MAAISPWEPPKIPICSTMSRKKCFCKRMSSQDTPRNPTAATKHGNVSKNNNIAMIMNEGGWYAHCLAGDTIIKPRAQLQVASSRVASRESLVDNIASSSRRKSQVAAVLLRR
eukprot:scaffold89075_cov36-Attheya_sp.AAC.2